MHQTQTESNFDDLARRKNKRVARVLAAGLIMAAIGAVAAFNQPAKRVQATADFAASNVAPTLPAAPSEESIASGRAASSAESPKPHFERSDEPAVEDSLKSYGG
jgi:hypothetical protein